jgi:hypothetical protein
MDKNRVTLQSSGDNVILRSFFSDAYGRSVMRKYPWGRNVMHVMNQHRPSFRCDSVHWTRDVTTRRVNFICREQVLAATDRSIDFPDAQV